MTAVSAHASDTATTIEVGDFIHARDIRQVCGFVIRRGHAGKRNGKPWIYGYWVRLASGREDFIGDDSAVLVAKSEDWWERATAEEASGC